MVNLSSANFLLEISLAKNWLVEIREPDPSEWLGISNLNTLHLKYITIYRTRIKFRGVQIFVVFVAYLFPTKINPPQLIFLPILPHRCIQLMIKFSVNIDHDIEIDVCTYRRFFWEITRSVTKIYCLLPVTSYCSYGLAT